MKANGRRRWRKFARHVRQREPGEFSNKSGHGALLKKQPYRAYRDPGPIPAKPFTPRSLVGMSTKARKSAVHAEMDKAREKGGPNKGKVSMFIADAILAKYRIGERLRPCPGCDNCGFRPTVKLWTLRRGLWWFGSLGVRDIKRIYYVSTATRCVAQIARGLVAPQGDDSW